MLVRAGSIKYADIKRLGPGPTSANKAGVFWVPATHPNNDRKGVPASFKTVNYFQNHLIQPSNSMLGALGMGPEQYLSSMLSSCQRPVD